MYASLEDEGDLRKGGHGGLVVSGIGTDNTGPSGTTGAPRGSRDRSDVDRGLRRILHDSQRLYMDDGPDFSDTPASDRVYDLLL